MYSLKQSQTSEWPSVDYSISDNEFIKTVSDMFDLDFGLLLKGGGVSLSSTTIQLHSFLYFYTPKNNILYMHPWARDWCPRI